MDRAVEKEKHGSRKRPARVAVSYESIQKQQSKQPAIDRASENGITIGEQIACVTGVPRASSCSERNEPRDLKGTRPRCNDEDVS